jgi:hypothetical protein
METEYGHRWWVLRACGRNPLVRSVDRIELLIVVFGIVVALVCAASAGALGTAVHDARSRVYTAQARTRHVVTARATDNSVIGTSVDDSAAARANIRWQANGTVHTGSLEVDHAVKLGDPLAIWVDGSGNLVDAPAPASQAAVDAVAVVYVALQAVILIVTVLVYAGRSHLDRRRDSAWERDIRCLIDDDGGRTNRKP